LEGVPLEIWVKPANDDWRLVDNSRHAEVSPAVPRRTEATAALRSGGFGYLLAPVAERGEGLIGADMLANPLAWDLDPVARTESSALFRIR
jgi:hypothetical protein